MGEMGMPDDDAPAGARGEGDERLSWLDLAAICEAGNEDSAIHLCALLQSAGIEARVRSAQVAAFDGVFSAGVGYWGHVMVPRAEAARARELLADFMRSVDASSDASGDDEDEASGGDDAPPGERGDGEA
jgi:hypothetical protein